LFQKPDPLGIQDKSGARRLRGGLTPPQVPGFDRLERSIIQTGKEMLIRSYPRLSVFIL
jgi:hypothetical protein